MRWKRAGEVYLCADLYFIQKFVFHGSHLTSIVRIGVLGLLEPSLNYRLCKIYEETSSSTAKAYKELVRLKASMDNQYDLVETCCLGGCFDDFSMNQMKNVAIQISKDYRSLLDEMNTHGYIYESEIAVRGGRPRPKSKVNRGAKSKVNRGAKSKVKKAVALKKLSEEELEIPTATRERWNSYPDTQQHPSKWEKTASDFEKSQYCLSSWVDGPCNKHFWGTLLGDRSVLKATASGNLSDSHLNGWVKYLLTKRKDQMKDVRWTAVPTFFDQLMLQYAGKADLGVHVEYANGKTEPWVAWWEVDRVFIPMHLADPGHGFLAVLHTSSFNMTVYDSIQGLSSRETTLEMIEDRWTKFLPIYLDKINFWKESRRVRMENLKVKMEHAKHVPQQRGPLGDCSVFLSMFMERLAEGDSLELVKSPVEEAMDYKHKMANVFYRWRELQVK